MLNRKWFFVTLVCLALAACGGGGSGEAGDGSRVFSFEGSTDLIALDLTGAQRAKPGAIGALEAY